MQALSRFIVIRARDSPKIVQERLGHASIQITLDRYSYVAPGLQEAVADKFGDFLKPKEADLDKQLKEIVQE